MNQILRASRRLVAAAAMMLGLLLCTVAHPALAQAPISVDPQVRAELQWEEILLRQDFDYLQLTPEQRRDLGALADYSRGRLDEIERKRVQLQKTIQAQHQAAVKGQPPTNADQQDVLQKQRQIQDLQAQVSREIVEHMAPKLGAILTKRQTVRAWLLMQNKLPPAEPRRVALTDPASGFVLPQMEGRDAIEEMVKTSLRQTYSQEVIDQALMPWEFASLASLAGGAGAGPGGGGAAFDRAKALQSIQEMDPRMGERMLTLGQKMLKQFMGGGGDPSAPAAPPVPPEVRAAINRDAAAIRKSIESDPEAFLSQAHGTQMLDALRPLARRLFLSPRISEALGPR